MNFLIQYAMSYIGVPYIYGGNSRLIGLDCSGFVLEILRSCGLWDKSDASAQDIYNKLESSGTYGTINAGSLLFFGDSVSKITHIGFAIDPYRMIESGSGDHTTTSLEIASQQNACIRIRLIKNRKDMVASLKPDYSLIGLL